MEPVAVELGEHAGNLIGRENLDLLVLDDRELNLKGRGVLDAGATGGKCLSPAPSSPRPKLAP
jgi:hypothetical protein